MTDRNVILRSAFWSGRLTYRAWRGIMRKGPKGHGRVFVQSFLHMPIAWLRKELGDDKFISIWPEVRKGFDKDSASERTSLEAWDAIWGVIAVGDSQYPISPQVARLSRLRREALRIIVQNPGISTYGLAKKTGRDYSRVLKDVSLLIKLREVETRLDPRSSRKVKLLLPMHSINARLAGVAA